MTNAAQNSTRIERIKRIYTDLFRHPEIRVNPFYPFNPCPICGVIGLFLLTYLNTAIAQPVPTLLKNAEREAKAGHFLAAAEYWERAGRLKNSDPEIMYQAAEAYARVRDYPHAADCYRIALPDPRFPMAGLRYARALKQQGRYEEASKAFENFGQQYRGNFKAVMVAVTENEISGCDFALQMSEYPDTILLARPLPDSVNTPENDFAPIPFSDNLLYFSQASGNRALLMRSKRKTVVWARPDEAKSLPESVSSKFRSGCFSPDGSRFYYAQSEEGCPAQAGGTVAAAPSALYCLRRTESGWAEPERLRAYLNLEGSTNLFPQVAQADGVEYLFFSSDRAGGFGGLDIYVCKRAVDETELDFSFPQNLGRIINTGADEVTPFFDADNKILWFSSLGHPSIGGMDVFKSEMEDSGWTKPQNAGAPINSPADDYYFVLKKRGDGAFLASNRRILEQKITTNDDDIFEVTW